RSPRVLRTHLLAYACWIYVAAFRARIGLCIYWPAYPAAPPLSASCSSGQRFAFSFLQIPPRGGHPCCSANTSPCRVCRGLSPPSECALPGAPKKRGRFAAPSPERLKFLEREANAKPRTERLREVVVVQAYGRKRLLEIWIGHSEALVDVLVDKRFAPAVADVKRIEPELEGHALVDLPGILKVSIHRADKRRTT